MTYTKEVSNPFKYRAHYNTTIRAIYTPLSCHIHIEQPTGGIITVVYNGKNYTTDFTVLKGQTIIVKTQVNDAYLSNQLSINGEKITPNTKYVVNSDINITLDLSLQSFLVKAKALRTCGLVINYNDQDTVLEAADESQTSFYVTYGETIVITAKPIEGYKVNGILIYEDGNSQPIKYNNNAVEYVVKKKISIELDCEIKKFWVEIDQPIETQNDSKTTWVIRNGDQIYDGFYANWGETLQIHAEPSAMTDHLGDTPNIKYDLSYISVVNEDDHTKENYNSGATITVKSNISINPIYKIHNCNIRITKNDKAIISAKVGETNYTDVDFIVPYGTNVSFTVTVKDTENYYFNDLTINGKSITQNINQRVTEDLIVNADIREVIKVNYFTIKINQPENAKIYVEYNNKTYTETFLAAEGSTVKVSLVADTGYHIDNIIWNGNSVANGSTQTVTGNLTLTGSVSIKTFTLSFGATTNQTYVATIGGTPKPVTSSATSYTVNYGTSYSVVYNTTASSTAAYFYTASSSVSGTVTFNVSIPAKTATANLKYYLLIVPAVSNQYYTLKLMVSPTYGGTLPSYITTATQAAQNSGNGLVVPYGTTYSITYSSPSTGYNVGASKSGTVTTDTIITHNAATLKTYTLTLNTVENGYWEVNGVNVGSSYSKYYDTGTSLKIECFANDGYIKPTELIMETTE